MTTTTCPTCSRPVPPAEIGSVSTPDPSVIEWFATDSDWSGEVSTAEAYKKYLDHTAAAPVPRTRFVADLAYLGVEQVLDGDTYMLVQD